MAIEDKSDPRAALDQLIRERGEDYASLSRLIGRNSAYIQQFIKRGVPRKLDEDDRRMLADYFGVPQHRLGGPADDAPRAVQTVKASAVRRGSELVTVPYMNAMASAGPGAVVPEERVSGRLAFRHDWLRELTGGSPAGLSVITVKGDSMSPTLSDGDDILVDTQDAADRLRDGIYVLRIEDMLNVKRLALNPVGRRLEIRSDNPAYPTWSDCELESVTIIGRVVWAGRRIS
jgi:phage repressor protein C with HTH and peptisase S24 domain